MELYRTTRVQFIENDELDIHSYLLDGEHTLLGVTSLMKKHGLSADYAGISSDVLKKAARIGTQAHRAIEAYCNGETVEETNLIKSFRKLGLNICETEYLMSDNELIASSMDLLNRVDDTTFDIIDIKRTEKVHKDALAWQLGIYRWLFLMLNPWAKVRNCCCLHVKKSRKKEERDDIAYDTCQPLILIEPKSQEEVLRLLDCERMCVTYSAEEEPTTMLSKVITPREVTVLCRCIEEEYVLKKRLESVTAEMSGIRDCVYEWMLANNVDSLTSDDGNVEIKLKRPYLKNSIDSTKLKNLYPDVANDCSKSSMVKGNITINIKQ